MSAPDSFENGSVIGGTYKVLDFIGEGGMGLVYKVEHLIMHRVLALKVLKTEHLTEAAWLRFRKEAQAIARLDHPNVVKIYDMNKTEDGRPYYTMDLLTGDSLADYLEQNHQLLWSDALPIFRQVCNGLAYANDRGIIHRDIKPGNIMLSISADTPEAAGAASVKIVDFGIAKLVDDGGQTIQALTAAGEVFGSPLYMSPEQCLGGKIDARSDMYSVGVSLFQALTGKPPFLGRTAVETTMLHQTTMAPPLGVVAPDLYFPERLESVVAKMLAKSPAERFHSLADVAALLIPAIDAEGDALKANVTENFASDDVPLFATAFDRGLDDQFQKTKKRDLNIRQPAGSKIPLILACAAVLIFAGVLTVFYSVNHERASGVKITDRALENKPTDPALANLEDSLLLKQIDDGSNRQVSKFEVKEVAAFLKSGVNYYSTVKRGEKGISKVFEFPQNFSFGSLFYTSPRGQLQYPARDKLVFPERTALALEGNYILRAYLRLLKFFRPDDLFSLKLENLPAHNEKLMPLVQRLTGLTRLELSECHLRDSDLRSIDHLPDLEMLNIAQNDITGAALGKSAVLPRLTILNVQKIDHVSPVLARINPNIIVLGLSATSLTREDLKIIAGLKHLSSLNLRNTTITDADLKLLVPLKNSLNLLMIDQCPNLNLSSLETLKQFKKMRELVLPERLKSSGSQTVLRLALPNLKNLH